MGISLFTLERTSALYSTTSSRNLSTGISASVPAPLTVRFSASNASKSWLGALSTTSPYICRNRRYESQENRGFPLCRASASTVRSLSPRLRMVSIIPGIETRPPLRTDTSSGFSASPKRRPVASSSCVMARSTSSRSPSGALPSFMYASHIWQAMVNPGGTGIPRLVISARLAPFPPRIAFHSRVPSARPLPKK